MRYKLRSSHGGNPSPKVKNKSVKKNPKLKVGRKPNKRLQTTQDRAEPEKQIQSPEAAVDVGKVEATSQEEVFPLKEEVREEALIDVTIEGDDLLQTDPLSLQYNTYEDEIKIDDMEIDLGIPEEEVKGARKFGKELTTLTNKKQPVKAKVLPKAKQPVNKVAQKRRDEQQIQPVSISKNHDKGQPDNLTIEDVLKKKSISYLGSVNFSDLNSTNPLDNQENNERMEVRPKKKEQTFAFLMVFTKSETPCVLSIESSPSGCVVSKKPADKLQESDLDILSDESEVEEINYPRTESYRNIRKEYCCIFCGDQLNNLTDHLKAQHEDEYLVKRLMDLDELDSDDSNKEKRLLLARLKSEGNYNSDKVIFQNFLWSGKVSTQQFYKSDKKAESDGLIKCQTCKSILSRKNVSAHHKTCNWRPTERKVKQTSANPPKYPEGNQLPQVERVSEITKENKNSKPASNYVNASNPTEDDGMSLGDISDEDIAKEKNTPKSEIFPWKNRIRGKHYCIYCKHLVPQFRNHMLKTHKREKKIAHYNRMLKECRADTVVERYKIIEDLCEEGDRIYFEMIENDPLKIKTLSSQLPETPPSLQGKYSGLFTKCRKCNKYYREQAYIFHACEGGYSSEEDENDNDDGFDWISKLTVSDWNSKVQVSDNLYLIGGSNQNDETKDSQPKDLNNASCSYAQKEQQNANNCSTVINKINEEHTSKPKSIPDKTVSSEQKTYYNLESSSKQKTNLNKDASLEQNCTPNKENSSNQKSTLNKGTLTEQKGTPNEEDSSKERTQHDLEGSSNPKATLNKDVNPEGNPSQNKEPDLAQATTSHRYYGSYESDDDELSHLFRRRKCRPWSYEEKALVINEFKHFIMSGSNPGTARCRELIKKHDILAGRNEMQVNTMIDNINRGKLNLPYEFQYLEMYRAVHWEEEQD